MAKHLGGRRTAASVVIAAVAVVGPAPAAATQWTSIAKTDVATFYIDLDAIVFNDAIATIWLKTEYATQGKKGEALVVEKWMHDCAQGRVKLLALTVYKANGSVIGSAQLPHYRQEWITTVPNSTNERIQKRVCGIGNEGGTIDELRNESSILS